MCKDMRINHYFKTHPISTKEFEKIAKHAQRHSEKMIDYMADASPSVNFPYFKVNRHGQITDWDKLDPSVKYWLMDR